MEAKETVSQETDKEKPTPEGAEPSKEGPEKEPPKEEKPTEEPKVRKSAQDRIRQLIKERDEALAKAQKTTAPPSSKEDLEEEEVEEEEPVTRKTVKKIVASQTKLATETAKKAVEEAIAPLIGKLTETVDAQELSEALVKFPEQAKDKGFVQRVIKYGQTHTTLPFEEIITLLLAKEGKTGEPEKPEEGAEKTRIGGQPSPAGRRGPSVAGKSTEELEKELREKTPEEIDEAIKGM